MSEIKRYDSAYPGSMHEREDGQYVDAEDSQSLAAQLLSNVRKAERDAEDLTYALEAERKRTAALEAQNDATLARIAELERENAALQARIDELMLEHCPDEMSQEQIDNYAKHQRPVSAEEEAAIDAAMKKKEAGNG